MMAVRHALRSLLRSPGFSIAVIFTLAVGVASVGAMFAIVYGVVLSPLPFGQPERLVSVNLQTPESGELPQPPALQATYERLARTLDGVGFQRTGSANVWVEGSDDGADSVVTTWISASMVPLLQVPPLLGRSFIAEEELRGGPDAVILSESEWRNRFNAAPDIIGRTLMVNSVRREIVGVMPARFAFPTAATRVWVPAKRAASATVSEFLYQGVARLAPGATPGQAQRELAALLPRLAEDFPRLDSGASTAAWLADARPTPVVRPLRDDIASGIARTLWLLAAAAALVLLVAWTNVANLLMIRADARQPELAVRVALGASRRRTATHFLAEAMLIGTTAGLLATVAAWGAVEALVAHGPADMPRVAELTFGAPALAFTATVTVAGIVVCALVPATRHWRASVSGNLRQGGRGASAGRSGLRLRAAMTTMQFAVALVVTIGSALLLRSAHGLHQVEPGFDATDVLTLRTQLPFARYDDAAAVAFYARLTDEVRQLPAVRSAGVAMKLPLGSGGLIEQPLRSERETSLRPLPLNIVDHGYFATMSIPLLAGRTFRALGSEQGGDVILGRRAAATLFGDRTGVSAVGQRVAVGSTPLYYTVVGVVDDVREYDLATPPPPSIYRPLVIPTDPTVEPIARRNMALVVQAGAPMREIVPAIRRIVHGIDPAVSVYAIEAMGDVVSASTARLSLLLTLITVAAAITLLLGTIGLYGVMAYLVALRTREFGVRLALGADAARIARRVAARGLALALCGTAVGFVLYALAAPFLRDYLFGVSVGDPATLAAATLVLLATASVASWLPARRAARVDPAGALRAE